MIADYYDGTDVLTECNGSADYFRISPSSLPDFFSSPRQWYGEHLLGEGGFEGSTATVIGTIVHHLAEARSKGVHVNVEQDVADYLAALAFEYDSELVHSLYPGMADVLISGCVEGTTFTSVEKFIYHEVMSGVYVAGTYDALLPSYNNGFVLRDYKTSTTKPSRFNYGYRMQLLTYAYVLKQQGINVNTIELQYATRPTKTLPARHFTFREEVKQEDFDRIEGQLKLVAESVTLWKEKPEMRYFLAQDYRLKVPEKKESVFTRGIA